MLKIKMYFPFFIFFILKVYILFIFCICDIQQNLCLRLQEGRRKGWLGRKLRKYCIKELGWPKTGELGKNVSMGNLPRMGQPNFKGVWTVTLDETMTI